MNTYIRTSKHSLKFSNKQKLEELSEFIDEYRRVAKIYLDYIWDNNFKHTYIKDNKQTTLHFNANTKLDLPNRLSTIDINDKTNLETFLTSRALQCCLNQVLSIIRGNIEKQKKRQFIVNQLRSQNKKISRKLRKAVRNNKPVKPDISNLEPELNANCVDLQGTGKEFDAFVQLKSFTNRLRGKTLNFPIKYNKVTNKWRKLGKQLNSFLFSKNTIDLRYKINNKQKKFKREKIVGADQGLKSVLTLSDKQVTPKIDIHGYSLESITKKLSRKLKGSKAFRKTQKHRENFINWSINKLRFSNIKEIRLEKIKHIRYKSKFSRYLSHWTYTNITNKLKRLCEEKEVLLTFQSSVYRSQRCNNCGLVRKSNRKGRVFHCKNCGLELDSDLNAALNHQHDLPEISYELRKLNLNQKGFFWNLLGFYNLTGEKLIVSLSKK